MRRYSAGHEQRRHRDCAAEAVTNRGSRHARRRAARCRSRSSAKTPAATITAYIVQVSLGDLPHDSIGYQSIFAAGLVLMLMTLVFNVIGFFLTRKFREAY